MRRSTTAARTCCATLKSLTGGKGPDVVYDPVGGDLAEPAFRSIAWRGRYLVIGFALGGIPALPLNLRCSRVHRSSACSGVSSCAREPRPLRRLAQLAQWYAQGKVKPAIDRRLPMAELARRPMHAWVRARCRASCCWSIRDSPRGRVGRMPPCARIRG
jgi:NADPH:quinone reductase-like Zn-dependent oxidoreductase